MPLKLTITSYQRLSPGQETGKLLDHGSISIGRAAQNDWILQDPERILSKKHCTIHYQEGGYLLTDLSVNGVYLNDSDQRIGRDQTVKLKDGDHFILGEYEIAATLIPSAVDLEEAEPEGPATDLVPTPILAPDIAIPEVGYPGGGIATDIAKPPFTDILAEDQDSLGFKHSPGPQPTTPAKTESPSDLPTPDRAFFEPPVLIPETPPPPPEAAARITEPVAPSPARTEFKSAIGPSFPVEVSHEPLSTAGELPSGPIETPDQSIIPEDWWLKPSPATVRSAAEPPLKPSDHPPFAEPVRQPIPAPPAPPSISPKQPSPAVVPVPEPSPVISAPSPPAPVARESTGPSAEALLQAFLDGAGLPRMRLSEDQLPEALTNIGAIFRETVQGLTEILLARSDVKGEFRLDRTTIGPMENNPLKTPPGRPPLSPEEIMILLLVRQKDAYMSPVQAVREGFNDIKAHQLAVMAGIQSALTRLLERFDPGNLETRLQQTVLDSILPVNRKAKYWDLFTAEYRAIAREAEDDFNELFGDEFARAYEERLRAR